jgi:hypothetical protein
VRPHRIIVLIVATLALSCVPPAPRAPEPASVTPPELAVRLRVGADSRLRIGALPWFDYDGRAGWATGTMTPTGDPGRYRLQFAPDTVRIVPLPMIAALPELPLRVTMRANADLDGWVDLCTGDTSLSFDATFQPEALGLDLRPLSVVTPLTSGTDAGYTGVRLDELGRGRLVGVAEVPATGDVLVDALLGLPAAAVADLAVDLDIATPVACPGATTSPRVRIETLPGAELDSVAGTVRGDAPAILETRLGPGGEFDDPVWQPSPVLPARWLVNWQATRPDRATGHLDAGSSTIEVTLFESIQPTLAGVPVGPPISPGPLRGTRDKFGTTVLTNAAGTVRVPAVVDVVGFP